MQFSAISEQRFLFPVLPLIYWSVTGAWAAGGAYPCNKQYGQLYGQIAFAGPRPITSSTSVHFGQRPLCAPSAMKCHERLGSLPHTANKFGWVVAIFLIFYGFSRLYLGALSA
jgi:hypothetical protein